MTNVVCQVGLAQQAVAAALAAPDAAVDVAAATATWQERCATVIAQLSDYPVVRPDGGWSLLIDTTRLGLYPGRGLAAALRTRSGRRDPDGRLGTVRRERYLRLVFANEPVGRLGDLRERFAAAF